MHKLKDAISLGQAGRLLRLRYDVVRRLAKAGKLRSERVRSRNSRTGWQWFVSRADIARCRRERPWRRDCVRRFSW